MTLLLILATLGFSHPAQAEAPAKNCFWAFGHYLVVDNSGQNLVLEIEGEECKTLKIAYGARDSGKITFNLENGGWKPLPKIGGPLPSEPKGKYKLNWAERNISIESIVQRHAGLPAGGEKKGQGPIPVILITYATTEDAVRKALTAVQRDRVISGRPQLIRIEKN